MQEMQQCKPNRMLVYEKNENSDSPSLGRDSRICRINESIHMLLFDSIQAYSRHFDYNVDTKWDAIIFLHRKLVRPAAHDVDALGRLKSYSP